MLTAQPVTARTTQDKMKPSATDRRENREGRILRRVLNPSSRTPLNVASVVAAVFIVTVVLIGFGWPIRKADPKPHVIFPGNAPQEKLTVPVKPFLLVTIAFAVHASPCFTV